MEHERLKKESCSSSRGRSRSRREWSEWKGGERLRKDDMPNKAAEKSLILMSNVSDSSELVVVRESDVSGVVGSEWLMRQER